MIKKLILGLSIVGLSASHQADAMAERFRLREYLEDVSFVAATLAVSFGVDAISSHILQASVPGKVFLFACPTLLLTGKSIIAAKVFYDAQQSFNKATALLAQSGYPENLDVTTLDAETKDNAYKLLRDADGTFTMIQSCDGLYYLSRKEKVDALCNDTRALLDKLVA